MRLLTLLLLVIGVTVSQARPQTQDVDNGEFVTTDNPEAVNIGDDDLELAGEGRERFLIVASVCFCVYR